MALVIANWKMHGRGHTVQATAERWLQETALHAHEVVWALPSIYLASGVNAMAGSAVAMAAQDVSLFEQDGAYTGEYSAAMVQDIGCRYVLIGHSERRRHFGEDAPGLRKKLEHSLSAGLIPIYCIGESHEEKMADVTLPVLREHMSVLKDLPQNDQGLVVAYEPVWAIGSGTSPSRQEIQETMQHLREHLLQIMTSSDKVRFVYGGSVDAALASQLKSCCNGVLVGSQSLKTEHFVSICESI